MHAEYAIGAPVAARDRHAHAAVDAMVAQQGGNLETRFGFEVGDDDRAARSERVAGLRMAPGRFVRGADAALPPAVSGTQQKLGVAGFELENLDELDIEDLCD